MSLAERLEKIKSPNLESQQQTRIVLEAVEDTLRSQKAEVSPTGYFAALLALFRQSFPNSGGVDTGLATSVVRLIDIVAPHAPQPLLRSEFSQILTTLAPALTLTNGDGPLLKPSVGCLETLLLAQDSTAWQIPQTQIGPRRAVAGLLNLAADSRPKIRKRALDAITKILQNPPPSPSLDHPAADMCAETALKGLSELAFQKSQGNNSKHTEIAEHVPAQIHALKLVRTIATASGGWPSKKMEGLCDVLLSISKSNNDFMTMASFEVFEVIFQGMAADLASPKLPRLLEVIQELRPSENDVQLLPPWIAILSKGYKVAAQAGPEETFQKLPELFELISTFMSSSSHNVRVSASECLISFMANCVPESVILGSSIVDERVLVKLGRAAVDLLSIKYQAAWMETFKVIGAMFDNLRWRAHTILDDVVRNIGDCRSHDSFTGKKEADSVIGKAIRAMGPECVLKILPLNLAKPKPAQPGRAWMLPILRDFVSNTNLSHFRVEFIPLSDIMYQKILQHGDAEKTMDIKIIETLIQQTWAILPGYCDLPLDLTESFDLTFAEMLADILYKQVDMRSTICKALQNLVESNKAILPSDEEDNLVPQSRVSKDQARKNLEHLSGFASNMLAVLFNVYSQTLPHFRGYILGCINAYLSITSSKELMATFERVTLALSDSVTQTPDGSLAEKQKQKQKQQNSADMMPPMSHTLMDLVVTISVHLPSESFSTLFSMASLIIVRDDDPQLQKKAYKLISRLAASSSSRLALQEHSSELQALLLSSVEKVSAPAKGDRLAAISTLIPFLTDEALHFIPATLSEVIISCKEINARTRSTAFDLLILMGERLRSASGSVIDNSKISHMPNDAPAVTASLSEYFTMVSAGLAGSTPHMVSASVTALTRILYHFRKEVRLETLTDLVQTMDLFLTSSNREIVQSVLGFVKVCIISLPIDLMQPRLPSLIPNLMVWSQEHKAHFKTKVKHIFERMVKRFGVDMVNRHCPEENRKLIANIRKTKDRKQRLKEQAKALGIGEANENVDNKKKRGRFENEYDEAVHGSGDSSDSSDVSDDEVLGRDQRVARKRGSTYIMEDDGEPLDLLDRTALANISSTKPHKQRKTTLSGAKMNLDGKLLFGNDLEDDAMNIDTPVTTHEKDEGGVGAYVEALKSRDAVKRGRGGRLKFSNKRSKDENEHNVDDEEAVAVNKQINKSTRSSSESFRGGRGRGRARGHNAKGGFVHGRRRLGEDAGSGRIRKSSRGRGG